MKYYHDYQLDTALNVYCVGVVGWLPAGPSQWVRTICLSNQPNKPRSLTQREVGALLLPVYYCLADYSFRQIILSDFFTFVSRRSGGLSQLVT